MFSRSSGESVTWPLLCSLIILTCWSIAELSMRVLFTVTTVCAASGAVAKAVVSSSASEVRFMLSSSSSKWL